MIKSSTKLAKRQFDYELFYDDDYEYIAFDAEKYGAEESRRIAAEELETNNLVCKNMFCYYGFGVDCDDEKRQGYWLADVPKGNCFNVWAYRKKEAFDE